MKIYPNKFGVYNERDAEAFRYQDSYLQVEAYILDLGDCWACSASYSVKIQSEGTMGCHAPLKLCPGVHSRDQAVDCVRDIVYRYTQAGRAEARSKRSADAWERVYLWAFSLERQLDLFAAS